MSSDRTFLKGTPRLLVFACLVGFVLWFGATAAWNTRRVQTRYQCAENMIRIGRAITAYESRYQSPPTSLELLSTTDFVRDADFECPAAKARNYEYTMNAKGIENRVWLSEPMSNHGDGANVLWGDGRCTFQLPEETNSVPKN